MMACPICGNKPANCDCSNGDRQAYRLNEELEELRNTIAKNMSDRRYEIAKVALQGLLASPPPAVDVGRIPQPLVKIAVSIADELLKELDK